MVKYQAPPADGMGYGSALILPDSIVGSLKPRSHGDSNVVDRYVWVPVPTAHSSAVRKGLSEIQRPRTFSTALC
jgi:hypothetical protein